jgi:hypothetical protein
MAEKVPFAKIDVEAAVKAKVSDLVVDAGTTALRALLLNHAVEKKHQDDAEDVEKWKHKAVGLEGRLSEVLKDKKAAEKALDEMTKAKEAAEVETNEKDVILKKAELAVDEGVLMNRCCCSILMRRWTSWIHSRSSLMASWWMMNDACFHFVCFVLR